MNRRGITQIPCRRRRSLVALVAQVTLTHEGWHHIYHVKLLLSQILIQELPYTERIPRRAWELWESILQVIHFIQDSLNII
jgi:hypothetical protein